ncbi:hypothetical protein BDW42DRAFT_166344 [Aspergillus taichungensis]|uniref:C2H2-type domain-containing protein n=1 Tax=Aspergillus taichungensis TaxID=482145 RepID=A0A2J5HYV0_9EURO|nr:hypothetical protein BDW42DRAFT_166344 [Aspergillus taichungensis]
MEWTLDNIGWDASISAFGEFQPYAPIAAQNEVPGFGMIPAGDADRPAFQLGAPSVQCSSQALLPNIQSTQQPTGPTGQNPDRLFRCEWKDCRYSGTFKRKAELIRHVNTIHIDPQTFNCPVEGCDSTFKNRKYNLKNHLRQVHNIASL